MKILICVVGVLLLGSGCRNNIPPENIIAVGNQETAQNKYNGHFTLQEKYPRNWLPEQYIDINFINLNTFEISGAAWWGTKENPGALHDGQINGTVTLKGKAADYIDLDSNCSVHLVFDLDTITATEKSEGSRCGGLNVTFSGKYKRM